MKYLLLLAAVLICCYLVRAKLRARRVDRAPPAQGAAGEDMVRCLHCGVHLPRSESLMVRGETYCCVEHQHKHDGGA